MGSWLSRSTALMLKYIVPVTSEDSRQKQPAAFVVVASPPPPMAERAYTGKLGSPGSPLCQEARLPGMKKRLKGSPPALVFTGGVQLPLLQNSTFTSSSPGAAPF